MEVVGATVAECEGELDGWMMWRYTSIRNGLNEREDFVGTEPRRSDAGVVDMRYWAGEGLEL